MDENEVRVVIIWKGNRNGNNLQFPPCFWVSEFTRGRRMQMMNHVRHLRKRLPRQKLWKKHHYMVLTDRRMNVGEIEKAVGMSYERMVRILHNELGLKKLSARWVSHLLNSNGFQETIRDDE